MNRTVYLLTFVLAVCLASFSQDASYYKAIQKASSAPIDSKQFKQIEQDSIKDYSSPETYDKLATLFGNTTERVWGVIYGEVFCNLTTDDAARNRIGSLAFDLYKKSLSSNSGNISVNLTENAEASSTQPPFESQFEMSFMMGAVPLQNKLSDLSIQTLAAIRKNQLSLWSQKKLQASDLVRRQQAVLAAGHWDAYNYWLFQTARPDEFGSWVKEHAAQYESWLEWQNKDRFRLNSPDLQRLNIIRRH